MIRGFRPPDFSEIYGNRGAIIGNPNLRPELGTTVDIGWTHQQPLHWLNHLQLALFARDTKDEIIFVQNAQRESIPMNFERTRMLGVESDWTIAFESWSWTRASPSTTVKTVRRMTLCLDNTLPMFRNG